MEEERYPSLPWQGWKIVKKLGRGGYGSHVDFLLFNQMDKQPVLAIGVDGTGFHEAGSNQAARDMKKNSILEKCAVPLLRLRTDGSGEKEKIRNALKRE